MLLISAADVCSLRWTSQAFDYSWLYWQTSREDHDYSVPVCHAHRGRKKGLSPHITRHRVSAWSRSVKQGWGADDLDPCAVTRIRIRSSATITVSPLALFMGSDLWRSSDAPGRIEKLIDRFAQLVSFVRGLSTFSRGGFLACAALGAHFL